MELSFCDLRCKDVVNICDGKNLGNINDMIIDSTCGRVIGIVVPASKNFFNFFKSNNDIFIPYNRICKIGKDIILVDIIMQEYNCNQRDQCYNDFPYNNQNNTNINIQQILEDVNKKQ
jgi:YlmC/YmxH family sporulation protein